MDPKVRSKLLTHHRRGHGVDVEALHDQCPLRWSSGKGPEMGSLEYRRLRRWNYVFVVLMDVWGYVDIYRRKKYVGGATEGPRGWRARPPASWLPPLFLDPHSKSPRSRLLRKSRSQRFHSVWTPFGIRLLRNPKRGKKTTIMGWASG